MKTTELPTDEQVSSYPEKIAELSELQKRYSELGNSIKEAKQMIADEHTPYKIGQIVDIKGYSHEGKQGKVKSVAFRSNGDTWRSRPQWFVRVTVLKIDGSDSLNSADWEEEVL